MKTFRATFKPKWIADYATYQTLAERMYHHVNIFLRDNTNTAEYLYSDSEKSIPVTRGVTIFLQDGDFFFEHPDTEEKFRISSQKFFLDASQVFLAWDGKGIYSKPQTHAVPDFYDDGDGGQVSSGRYAGSKFETPAVIQCFECDPEVFTVNFAPKALAKIRRWYPEYSQFFIAK